MTQCSSSNGNTVGARIESAQQLNDSTAVNSTSNSSGCAKHDILLNNFQIKKKRFRVLFNCDHIVWERLDAAKRAFEALPTTKKELEFESEQLSQKTAYGNNSNYVHINEIIRVTKSKTRNAALHNTGLAISTPNPFNLLQQQYANTNAHATTAGATTTTTTTSTATAPTPKEQYLTIHYAERIIKSDNDCNRWRVRMLTLYNGDAYIVNQWYDMLSKLLLDAIHCRKRVQRLLVFINPYGGRKQGLQIYERCCKPLFQLAGIDASCIISQRSNQIRDILMSHDLSPFDAICCVGGDGTVAEVINGLIFRTICDLGIDMDSGMDIPKPYLAIGVIPAGSTDTVAYTLHGTADPRTAAIHLALGQRRGLDICSVRNQEGIVRFCASLFSYGYLGDVAAKSEQYRWMGTKRYEYTGVKAFLTNRGYNAEIRLLQDDDDDVTTAATSATIISTEPTISNNSEVVAATTGTENAQTAAQIKANITNINNNSNISDNIETICYANCNRCSAALSTNSIKQFPLNNGEINCDTDYDNTDGNLSKMSSLTHFDEKSTDDNVDSVATNLNSIYNNNDLLNVSNIKNINMVDCDKNIKTLVMDNQLQKDKQIKQLLAGGETQTELTRKVLTDYNVATTSSNAAMHNNINSFTSSTSAHSSNIINNQQGNNNEKWKVIKGNFFMVVGANIACACTRSPNGMAPYSHLGDGYLDLILVRKTSLLNNVRLVKNTMGRNGDIRKLPFVETYRTRKFYFRTNSTCDEEYDSIRGSCQPITASYGNVDKDVSSWNCDGEVVTDLDILMSSHCQLIDVFMRGPHAHKKTSAGVEKRKTICCCN